MIKEPCQEKISYCAWEEAFEQVKIQIDAALKKSPPAVREYLTHLALSQGKFLRSRALLITALNGENKVHENAIKVSVAMEILHLATLVHDDIIDEAKTRRGIDTLQYKYGKKPAVICGDYLLCVALRTFSQIKEGEKYEGISMPDYMSRLCMGELSQHENNRNADLSVHKYLRIIRGKTAALFEGAYKSGGIFSGEDENAVANYGRLGRYVGMIFQLTDDCIDYAATENLAKKPVRSDYEQGVITMPLIHTIKATPAIKPDISEGTMENDSVLKLVEKCGGVEYTKLFSKRYYGKAVKIIEKLDIGREKRELLMEILDKAYYGVSPRGLRHHDDGQAGRIDFTY